MPKTHGFKSLKKLYVDGRSHRDVAVSCVISHQYICFSAKRRSSSRTSSYSPHAQRKRQKSAILSTIPAMEFCLLVISSMISRRNTWPCTQAIVFRILQHTATIAQRSKVVQTVTAAPTQIHPTKKECAYRLKDTLPYALKHIDKADVAQKFPGSTPPQW